MFTGIVQSVGQIKAIETTNDGICLLVGSEASFFDEANLGDSIAINGVCLTVITKNTHELAFEVSPETSRLTSLGMLDINSKVNLEPALRLQDRLGGHVVSGHVDGLGTITQLKPQGDFYNMQIRCPANLLKYIAKKGSLTVDGISLTVNDVNHDCVDLMLIPHTWSQTNLHIRSEGDKVNLEIDLLARYVERLMAPIGE